MLTQCKECGEQVSDKAISCPHCGAPLREAGNPVLDYLETRAKFRLRACGIAAVVGAVLFLLAAAIRSQTFLTISAFLGICGLLGVFVHSIRLSHLAQSRRGGWDRKG